MDEEERDREARRVGRTLITDDELNSLLDGLAEQHYLYAIDHDASKLPITLICYEAEIINNVRKAVTINITSDDLTMDNLIKLGEKIFDMGLSPVAIFLVGFGDFFVRTESDNGITGPGIIIGGITLDSRSVHGQVELAMGREKLFPVNKHVFHYVDNDNRERFNKMIAIYDGYAELMKVQEVSLQLAEGFSMMGLWKKPQ